MVFSSFFFNFFMMFVITEWPVPIPECAHCYQVHLAPGRIQRWGHQYNTIQYTSVGWARLGLGLWWQLEWVGSFMWLMCLYVVHVGLSLGYWATLLRDVPFSAFYVLFYTQSKQAVMRGKRWAWPSGWEWVWHFCCKVMRCCYSLVVNFFSGLWNVVCCPRQRTVA